jgi:hypothetical protein
MTRAVAVLLVLAASHACHAGLTTNFQVSGNVRVQVSAFGQGSGSTLSGAFSVGIVPGSSVVFAGVFTGDFLGPGGTGGGAMSASLNGSGIGIAQPFDQDPSMFPTSFAYLWNAGSVVTGSGTYNLLAGAAPGAQMPFNLQGAALVVITSHPNFAPRTITINSGVWEVGDTSPTETASTTFQEILPNSIGAGQGFLSLFTLSDDSFNSGESASFNGQSLLLGPGDFDANLGVGASHMVFPVTTTAGGTNSVSVTTNTDLFNWHLAILESPIPSPGVAWVLALGLGARRRWRATCRRACPGGRA